MTNIGTGRYRGIYNVASTHGLEGIHLSFSWAEGGNADVLDKSFTVSDDDVVGYLASDRTRDDTESVRVRYVHKWVGGDPAQKVTHVRAIIGTPGSTTTDDTEIDQVVTQVDADTAEVEQQ